ncbi:MAG: outer membrane beta-barrel protein [Opitutae bacterium]|nr:outer membrane beta-barrel protein [Opitutae bacterium]
MKSIINKGRTHVAFSSIIIYPTSDLFVKKRLEINAFRLFACSFTIPRFIRWFYFILKMKNRLFSVSLTLLLVTICNGSLSIGLSLLYDNNDLGSEIGFAPKVDWQITDNDSLNHTLQAELDFLSMEGKKGVVMYDGSAKPLMLNYLMDWNPGDIFGLYAGAGIGLSFNSMTNEATKKEVESTDFAWQFQLGTSLTFAESYKINLGYRHLNTAEVNDVEGGHNIIDLGFRFQF